MIKNSVRERIKETAFRLFFSQGYNSTGINQIIEEGQIAKASLYQYFKSKSDILTEYLVYNSNNWFKDLERHNRRLADGKESILGLFAFRLKRLKRSGFKGCAFLKIIYELPNLEDRNLKVIVDHKMAVKSFILNHVIKLDKKSTKRQNLELAEVIYNIFEGASVQCSILRNAGPIPDSITYLNKLLK